MDQIEYNKLINRSCFFISDDPLDRAEFTLALGDTLPETLCFAVSDGRDALFMMEDEKMIPNFIFVEMNMPHMNGLEFIKALKKSNRFVRIPVVVHMTDPCPAKIAELKELGVLAIYLKPYNYYGLRNFLTIFFRGSMLSALQN